MKRWGWGDAHRKEVGMMRCSHEEVGMGRCLQEGGRDGGWFGYACQLLKSFLFLCMKNTLYHKEDHTHPTTNLL